MENYNLTRKEQFLKYLNIYGKSTTKNVAMYLVENHYELFNNKPSGNLKGDARKKFLVTQLSAEFSAIVNNYPELFNRDNTARPYKYTSKKKKRPVVAKIESIQEQPPFDFMFEPVLVENKEPAKKLSFFQKLFKFWG